MDGFYVRPLSARSSYRSKEPINGSVRAPQNFNLAKEKVNRGVAVWYLVGVKKFKRRKKELKHYADTYMRIGVVPTHYDLPGLFTGTKLVYN